ncbi:MAG: hypothetical protein ACFB00_04505 [Parvularculaceae bacterium]
MAVRNFSTSTDGSIAVIGAALLALGIAAAGVAIDFARGAADQARLQAVADALAMRGAREFVVANAAAGAIEASLRSAAPSYFSDAGGEFDIEPRADAAANQVAVTLERPAAARLIAGFGGGPGVIRAEAVAEAVGGMNVCVIALDPSGERALDASVSADLEAPNCALFSNSTASSSVSTSGAATITADLICSSGGYAGGPSSYRPTPVTDSPTRLRAVSRRSWAAATMSTASSAIRTS